MGKCRSFVQEKEKTAVKAEPKTCRGGQNASRSASRDLERLFKLAGEVPKKSKPPTVETNYGSIIAAFSLYFERSETLATIGKVERHNLIRACHSAMPQMSKSEYEKTFSNLVKLGFTWSHMRYDLERIVSAKTVEFAAQTMNSSQAESFMEYVCDFSKGVIMWKTVREGVRIAIESVFMNHDVATQDLLIRVIFALAKMKVQWSDLKDETKERFERAFARFSISQSEVSKIKKCLGK